MPEGTTVDLSKTAVTNGKVSSAVIQPTTGNDVCVLWREMGQDDAYHLYLWRSATGTASVSPGIVNEGIISLPEFYCDNDGNARIGWVDPGDNQVVYWDEAANTQVQISNSDGYHARGFNLINIQDKTYLIWSKNSKTFLWDSTKGSALEIATGGYDYPPDPFVDIENTIHMIWHYTPMAGPTCYFHWDNVSQTITNIGPCDDLHFSTDGEKNLHVVWSKIYGAPTPINYWDVTENITASIAYNGAVNNLQIDVGPDDTCHMFWQDFVTDNLYYSNSESLTARFVTDSSSDILQTNNAVWDFDSSGGIHVVWIDSIVSHSDKNVVYWTPALTEPITLTESTLFYPSVDIHIDQQDTVHAVAHSQNNTLHYWNDQMDNMQTIASSVKEYLLTSDADGEGLVFYSTYPGEFYYWSSKTQSGDQLGYSHTYYDIHDASGWLYLYWVGVQQQYSSDSDIYAVWKPRDSSNYSVYLPAIINP